MPDLNTLLDQHVTLVYESVDRVFLNGYVAKLQEPDQLAWFLGQHRGEELPRYELLGKMTSEFVAAIEQLAKDQHIPVVHFEKGQRKETIAEPHFAQAALLRREGVVLVGIAQEKANVFRPPRKGQRGCGGGFAAGRNSAFVKHVYLYIWDRDFGPTFIKFCTYAPWSVRVCLNGHMWLRQHLQRCGHYVEPLDNGIADVDDPAALTRLCRRFGPQHIQRYFDRWMYRLPNPFPAQDRRAGYTYQLSILQLEVARTEVFDRPLHGRQFFEEVIRQHLDLGRPENVSLIFSRRIPRRRGQPAARTRVFTQDVSPNLHVSHRSTHVKQYSVTSFGIDEGVRSRADNSVKGRRSPHWSVMPVIGKRVHEDPRQHHPPSLGNVQAGSHRPSAQGVGVLHAWPSGAATTLGVEPRCRYRRPLVR